jgi:membrane-associated protein
MTTDTLGRGSWLLLVLLALAVVPVLVVRAVVGVRPVSAAPDVASLERSVRRSRFTPLVGDLQP